MGWQIGANSDGRDVGYGVPAICDHPDCTEEIGRGVDNACGGMHDGGQLGCGRYFCDSHLTFHDPETGQRSTFVCARCANGEDPFPAKPDTREWMLFKLTDDSWAEWREQNPNEVDAMARSVAELTTWTTVADAHELTDTETEQASRLLAIMLRSGGGLVTARGRSIGYMSWTITVAAVKVGTEAVLHVAYVTRDDGKTTIAHANTDGIHAPATGPWASITDDGLTDDELRDIDKLATEMESLNAAEATTAYADSTNRVLAAVTVAHIPVNDGTVVAFVTRQYGDEILAATNAKQAAS